MILAEINFLIVSAISILLILLAGCMVWSLIKWLFKK